MNAYVIITRGPKGVRGGKGAVEKFAVVAESPEAASAAVLAQAQAGSEVYDIEMFSFAGAAAVARVSCA